MLQAANGAGSIDCLPESSISTGFPWLSLSITVIESQTFSASRMVEVRLDELPRPTENLPLYRFTVCVSVQMLVPPVAVCHKSNLIVRTPVKGAASTMR